jgi:hypothetical protein
MKRMSVVGLCLVAAFALSAVFAGAASAGKVLVLSTSGKGALAPGTVIKAESTNLIFETAGGNL